MKTLFIILTLFLSLSVFGSEVTFEEAILSIGEDYNIAEMKPRVLNLDMNGDKETDVVMAFETPTFLDVVIIVRDKGTIVKKNQVFPLTGEDTWTLMTDQGKLDLSMEEFSLPSAMKKELQIPTHIKFGLKISDQMTDAVYLIWNDSVSQDPFVMLKGYEIPDEPEIQENIIKKEVKIDPAMGKRDVTLEEAYISAEKYSPRTFQPTSLREDLDGDGVNDIALAFITPDNVIIHIVTRQNSELTPYELMFPVGTEEEFALNMDMDGNMDLFFESWEIDEETRADMKLPKLLKKGMIVDDNMAGQIFIIWNSQGNKDSRFVIWRN